MGNSGNVSEEKENRLTSGFTTNLAEEMNDTDGMAGRNGFRNIKPFYVSASGHARLFTATRYGKRYMLKCLKEDFLYTPVYQQVQNKEFEIGVQLEHPNICRTVGLEQVDGLGQAIVLEFVDGDNLQSLIDRKLLTPQLAKRISGQLMDALEYMHNKQIIHRDLKPSNIMVTHKGRNVKVIDFGLSDSDSFCVLKNPAGTSGYIAPEQLLPDSTSEPSADIYSLGCVFGEMSKVARCRKLKTLATLCTVRDINRRPKSIGELRRHFRHSSRLLTAITILVIYCLAMIALLAVSYWKENKQETTSLRHQKGNVDNPRHDENKVVDIQSW